MSMIESKDRATSDPAARKDVMKQMEKEGVEYVLFWFTDIEGHLKSFAITPSEIEGALNDGMGFDGSSITGFNAIEESDMVAIPDPDHVPPDADARGRGEGRPHDLRRRQAERRAVRGRSALRDAPRARADGVDGLRHVQHRAGARVLPLRGQQGHRDARRGRLLRDDGARRGDRAAQRDDQRARDDGHRDRVPPPRGRAVAARDRHALRLGARHGRPDDHLPADRQGGRGEERRLRDVHAEAAVRRERLGHAHAHVAVQGRPQPVLRRRRPVQPLAGRQAVHRRPAPPRARAGAGLRPVGELVQAARARASRRRSTSRGRSATARR